MDHILVPLDPDHLRAVDELAAAAGRPRLPLVNASWHITVAAFDGLSSSTSRAVVEEVAAVTAPFVVHAHGFGLFVGSGPNDLSLYVPVVRSTALEAVRADLHDALTDRGARLAPWIGSEHWLPHITVVNEGVGRDDLLLGLSRLLQRHHPSWRVPVAELALSTGDHDRHWQRVPVGTAS